MLERITKTGYFIAIDGPNDAGKSTLINEIKRELELSKYTICVTKEPTNSELGMFLRQYAEKHSGMEVACMVAVNRYEHLANEISPALSKGKYSNNRQIYIIVFNFTKNGRSK